MGVKIASGPMLQLMEGGLMNEDHEFNGVDEFCGLNSVNCFKGSLSQTVCRYYFFGLGFSHHKRPFCGICIVHPPAVE